VECGQSTTRRALFVGAAATFLAANVAGTVAAELFPTPDMMRMAADGMIQMYKRYGVDFIPQPNGSIGKCIFIGEGTTYDHDVVTGLDQKMKDWPDLRRAVLDRVRDIHFA
jgi:hypothetical protein